MSYRSFASTEPAERTRRGTGAVSRIFTSGNQLDGCAQTRRRPTHLDWGNQGQQRDRLAREAVRLQRLDITPRVAAASRAHRRAASASSAAAGQAPPADPAVRPRPPPSVLPRQARWIGTSGGKANGYVPVDSVPRRGRVARAGDDGLLVCVNHRASDRAAGSEALEPVSGVSPASGTVMKLITSGPGGFVILRAWHRPGCQRADSGKHRGVVMRDMRRFAWWLARDARRRRSAPFALALEDRLPSHRRVVARCADWQPSFIEPRQRPRFPLTWKNAGDEGVSLCEDD